MAKRTCTVEGCERTHEARGLCATHYARWRTTGAIRPDNPIDSPAPSRLESLKRRIRVDSRTGCWLWTGYIAQNGYGKASISRTKARVAHRVVYEELRGPVPEGLDLDHLCRNRRCVNPDHLEPVTRAENLHRGLGSKLSTDQRNDIRVRYEAGEKTRELARAFGVSEWTAAYCARGHLWKSRPRSRL